MVKNGESVYIVVYVFRGLLSAVEAYRNKKMAVKREREFRKEMNVEYDDTGVFQVRIGERDP